MPNRNEWLYVSADHSYFTSYTLMDLAADFAREGGRHLVIDEIHKYPGWSRELKMIYDGLPSLNVIFTGSSVLDIKKGYADLSRRALMFESCAMTPAVCEALERLRKYMSTTLTLCMLFPRQAFRISAICARHFSTIRLECAAMCSLQKYRISASVTLLLR